jgi:hypothetical protein
MGNHPPTAANIVYLDERAITVDVIGYDAILSQNGKHIRLVVHDTPGGMPAYPGLVYLDHQPRLMKLVGYIGLLVPGNISVIVDRDQ